MFIGCKVTTINMATRDICLYQQRRRVNFDARFVKEEGKKATAILIVGLILISTPWAGAASATMVTVVVGVEVGSYSNSTSATGFRPRTTMAVFSSRPGSI